MGELRCLRIRGCAIAKEGRQNPSLLRKRILSCSSSFRDGKNPQCITVDTSPAFAKATAGEAFVGPDVALA
jgi:hypothetical protein